MQLNSISPNLNFTKAYRKVHTRTPFLIHEIHYPVALNNTYSVLITGKTNSEIENPSRISETQAELRAIAFDRLIKKQQIARSRSGDIIERLAAMERFGYDKILEKTPKEILNSLFKLKPETIATLNDYQLYRLCLLEDGNRKICDGLLDMEKEFTTEELQRISETDTSTIIYTWVAKLTKSEESFNCLTKYIHQLARK